ncbi:MAG: RagB/SusD family nutrient uptake outer membrane protein, partial [Fulvivirga sp.]
MINKIKIKSRPWIPALVLGALMSSCSLDIDETDSLITEGGSSVFNGVENPAGSVDNLYNGISGQIASQENIYSLSEVTSDILLVPTRGTDWGDNGVWRTLHAHTWGPTHLFVTNVWNNKNSAVLRATEVIDPLSNASAEQIAQAKFVRAYNMFWVMDCFGQVPFRNPTDGPEVLPSVFTRAEAYDLVVKDLEEAIDGLPDANPTSDNKLRATKATAKWLLAKVKLNSGVYLSPDPAVVGAPSSAELQDVITLVDEIEADGFSLVGGEFFDLFVGPTFTNSDVIWNVSADVGSKMWNGLHYNQAHSGNGGGGWNGFTTLAEFYDSFEGPANDNSIGSGQEERRGYTQTLASTNADNEGFGFGFQLGQMYGFRDGAAVALTNRTGDPLSFTKELPGLIGNNEVTGMRLLKYSPANGSFTSGTVLARFADAHLMRAEAMLRLGDAAGALAEVNELRALRENTPPLASLSEAQMLAERGRELYMEYVRRNDMIRFDAYKSAWEFKEEGDGHTNLFPIPASALLSNPNLVQNAG